MGTQKYVLGLAVILSVLSTVISRDKPPMISIPQGNRWRHRFEYIRSKTEMEFHCQATGRPAPTYMWTYNGTEVVNNDEYHYDSQTGTLTMTKRFDSSGDFQCIASNSNGKAMTPYLTLIATKAEPFPGSNTGSTIDAVTYASEYFTLECLNVPESVPSWIFWWERGRKVNDAIISEKIDTNDDRMVIDHTGTLHFLWTEMGDNNYMYQCGGTNSILYLDSKNTQSFRLTVNDVQTVDRAPELKYQQDKVVYAGEDAELMCIFTYFSTRPGESLTINWFFKGERIKGQTGPKLLLEKVPLPNDTQSREGEYLCEATVGSKTATGKVHLKIVAPPQFVPKHGPSGFSLPLGNDAVFQCQTNSHNSYIKPPVWMVNSEPILGCPLHMFECERKQDNGRPKCIQDSLVCNVDPDCEDGSDERNCPIACSEGGKACKGSCIGQDEFCPELICDYPGFKCHDETGCLTRSQVCDGKNDCKDASDEQACPNQANITIDRFVINSQRNQLVLPNVQLTDNMCIQCMVTNDYGTVSGDGCLTVIDRIKLLVKPNDTYEVMPDTYLNIGVEAETDKLYQNQMKYVWHWYSTITDPVTGETKNVMETLPPGPPYNRFIRLSQNGKNLTIIFPEVEGQKEEMYEMYNFMKDKKYSVVVSHQYDRIEFPFYINGEDVVPPTPAPVVVTTAAANLWFIALILAILILFVVIALIVCYLYRNRGGTYPLDKKEHQAGHDPEQELKDSGFHDVGRVDDDYDDKPNPEERSLSESVKPYESDDEDITEEYGGDFDVSKFNEDGSFIGLYGDKKSKYSTKEATV